MNENVLETQSQLSESLSNGLYSVLYKRINSVTITDKRISDAFSLFVRAVDCDKTISVAEVLLSAEAVIKDCLPDENATNVIYCFDKAPVNSKFIKYSVPGLYSLFALRNGMSLDIDAMGGSLSAGEHKRFLVMPPKKAEKLISKASKFGIDPIRVGQMLSMNKIILTRGGTVIDSADKSLIDRSSPAVPVNIGSEHFDAFLGGYHSVCSISLCNRISFNNVVRFGLAGGLENVLARALGFFTAALSLKALPIRCVYIPDASASVAVPRPNVADGDYFYLLKLKNDENGLPDKAHLAQLLYYLSEKKRMGIIKDVLPIKENIEGVIKRLCTENLEYVSLEAAPDSAFGVVVSVPRGHSVNGIKLGYFKNI